MADRIASVDSIVKNADLLRDSLRFMEAASAYREAVEREPARADLWVQLGNMHKDSGRFAAAEEAYLKALALSPDDPDTLLQLGRARQLDGRQGQAIQAFTGALKLAPGNMDALEGLAALGAGWEAGQTGSLGTRLITGTFALLRDLKAAIKKIEAGLPLLESLTDFPLEHYPLYRQQRQTPPAPPCPADIGVVMLGDAELQDTQAALAALRAQHKQPCFLALPDLSGHSAITLSRLSAARPDLYAAAPPGMDGPALAAFIKTLPATDVIVLCAAPLILDPHALGWLATALSDTQAIAAFADEDTIEIGSDGDTYRDPVFRGQCDMELLEQGIGLGSLLAVRTPALIEALSEQKSGSPPDLAALALRLAGHGEVRGVCQTLASRPAGAETAATPAARVTFSPPAGPEREIAVIIPTRDRVELLAACLAALIRTAGNRNRVKPVVVDNGSESPETRAFLEAGAAQGQLSWLRADEPFNWSRLNRLGAMSTDAPLLVFMNNDVEMISTGWDTRLAGLLSRAEVGAVGARLTYPDGTLQHAGVVMGFGTVCDHDGRGEPGDAEGPLRRYVTRHSVTAVTGAFLAVRRETFQALGGFDDEALPLWFNDTDFCLKSWAAGLRVLYEPAISAVHHEAKTLGSAIAGKDRDDYFLSSARTMRARWGAAMDADRWSSPRFRRAIAPVLTIMR